jgi:hypothetical protein
MTPKQKLQRRFTMIALGTVIGSLLIVGGDIGFYLSAGKAFPAWPGEFALMLFCVVILFHMHKQLNAN